MRPNDLTVLAKVVDTLSAPRFHILPSILRMGWVMTSFNALWAFSERKTCGNLYYFCFIEPHDPF
ncbi:hypothetical protein BOX24_03020 [Leptospirillum ferriphilum]|uniref:Uncharacterized protein n=2 Tax=Leptospirillum ferriphilum TaxID=178606 RepID=A0A059Y370_9BACT|nr:hypothetical protein Y981_11295 [Leptospirillum ferriphilum YSK]OOH73980.1 hypothetical protein BOX24_03020 [Leptospirillum ferriphilum]